MSYRVKIKGSPHSHKLSLFCPHCRRITGTIDDEYLQNLGFCRLCFTMHVEDRKVPDIDLVKYAPPNGIFFNMTKEEVEAYFKELNN